MIVCVSNNLEVKKKRLKLTKQAKKYYCHCIVESKAAEQLEKGRDQSTVR